MTQTLYIIRNKRTGFVVEIHDNVSKDYAYHMVAIHNSLYPNDQWLVSEEEVAD